MISIFIVHVDGYIGAIDSKDLKIRYKPQEKFIEFIRELKTIFPDSKMRCVNNYGIEEAVKNKIEHDLFVNKVYGGNSK